MASITKFWNVGTHELMIYYIRTVMEEVEKCTELIDHYSASFQSITEKMEMIKRSLLLCSTKDDTLKSIVYANTNSLALKPRRLIMRM